MIRFERMWPDLPTDERLVQCEGLARCVEACNQELRDKLESEETYLRTLKGHIAEMKKDLKEVGKKTA